MANKAREIEKIKSRIVSVKDADPHVKVLLYGRNGNGKTRVAATAPKPLIVDINERGTRSVRNYKGVKVLPVSRWDEITYAYWYLREGDHPYESVVLDTITMMQAVCIRHVLKESEDRDPNKDPAIMSQREWGKVAELMKPTLLNFRNLPMHVVFVAQERVVDDPDTETRERVPDLSPGSRATATACVEVIGRVYQREVRAVRNKREVKAWETRLLVGPHDEYVTKDRTGSLGRIVRNPTIPSIIEAASSGEEV
jgi:hypothetical protein